MFILNIATTGTTSAALPLATYGEAVGLSLPQFTPLTGSPLEVVNTVPIPPYQGELVTIALPPTISAITSIQVDGTIYTQAPGTPSPGEYAFDPFTQQLQFYPLTTPASLQYVGLLAAYPTGTIPGDAVAPPYPGFFTEWNIDGSCSISRSLKGHPSCNLQFSTKAINESSVRSRLANGSYIVIWGVGYRVQSLDIVRLSRRLHPVGIIGVRLSLQGCWAQLGSTIRSPLDKAISLPSLGTSKTNLAALAARSQVPYSGPLIEIKIPNGTPKTTTVTLRQEIESRALTALGFPYYSNPSAVEVRSYGRTAIHFLSEADILSEEEPFNLPGHGAYWDGVKIVEELNNAVFNPADSSDDAGDERSTICEGPDKPEEPSKETTDEKTGKSTPISLRNSMAFDMGGPTKTKTCTTYLNGQPIQAKTIKYGFIYSYIDVYAITFSGNTAVATYSDWIDRTNLKRFWVKIEESTTNYIYDRHGYLERVERTGFTKVRFKTESPDNPETVAIAKQLKEMSLSPADPNEKAKLEAQIALYQYPAKFVLQSGFLNNQSQEEQRAVKLPINDTTYYELELLSAHYDDIKVGAEDVPPKFCRTERRRDFSYQLIDDPTSTKEEEKPPLSTGKNFEQTTERVIIRNKKPEMYKEVHSTSNQEGFFLRRTLKIADEKDVKGRPPVHSPRLERSTNEFRSGVKVDNSYKYIYTTHGAPVGAGDPEQGSVSYPDVNDPEKARQIAQVDYSMRNAASESVSLKVRYRPQYNEGDLISFAGRLYVIQSLGVNFVIERRLGQPRVRCPDGIDMKLGRYMQLPVLMRREKKDEAASTPSSGVIRPIG